MGITTLLSFFSSKRIFQNIKLQSTNFSTQCRAISSSIECILTDNLLLINGEGKMKDFSEKESPWYNEKNNIYTINIEQGVTSIGSYAFQDCLFLTTVTLSESLVSIGNYSFSNCIKLPSINIFQNVNFIGFHSFFNCSSLSTIDVDSKNSYYSSLNGVLYNSGLVNLIQFPCSYSNTSYSIPETVIIIEDSSFYSNNIITTIIIGNKVEIIQDFAFYKCFSLKSVTFGNSLKILGSFSFSFTSITNIKIPDSITELDWKNVFQECPFIEIDTGNGLQTINPNEFSSHETLETVIIGNNITNIQNHAFFNCKNLKSIKIGKGTKSIEDSRNYINTILKINY